MFSYFIFIFSAVVSVWAGGHFFLAWRKSHYAPHWEFGMFFFVLGAAFIVPIFLPFINNPATAFLAIELTTFFILFSFAFVLRALVNFQGIRFSPNLITVLIGTMAVVRLFADLNFPSVPEVKSGLLYFHFAPFNHATYIAFLLLYTCAMGVTLFSNLQNVHTNRTSLFYLASAFLMGGISGVFVTAFDTFWPILWGYVLFLMTFVFVLFFLASSRAGENK